MRRWYLGVDGGGTATRAVLADEGGRVRAVGRGGPANYNNVGEKRAVEAVAEAIAMTRQAAPEIAPDRIFFGLAAVKGNRDRRLLLDRLVARGLATAHDCAVDNDLCNALAGGLAGRPGLAIIAGTGSNCLGRDASGQTVMCGGWGWLLDDGGSGFAVGLCALRLMIRGTDGREAAPPWTGEIMKRFGLEEPEDLLGRLHSKDYSPTEVAALAPLVIESAMSGYEPARGILEEGAKHLAEMAAGARSRLDFPGVVPVVLLGGLLRGAPLYREMTTSAILHRLPMAVIEEPILPAPAGAVLEAMRRDGRPVTPEIIGNLQTTLRALAPEWFS